jgi:flagellar motor switch protein FliN/FliY
MQTREDLNLTIELGRTVVTHDEMRALEAGMVLALDKPAGDAVDVLIDGKLAARGELVVVEGNFCVRVVELVTARMAA